MQSRCVYCKREQYAPAVYSISLGEHPCVWCGEFSKPMTEQEYSEAYSQIDYTIKNEKTIRNK